MPDKTPIINAKDKPFKVSPPKINNGTMTSNVVKDVIGRGGCYYMRGHKWDEGTYGESDWTVEEMTNIFKKISQLSMEYYIDKYGK